MHQHEPPVAAEPKLFVGGLGWEASRDEVHDHFARYGPIKACVLLTHHDTGKSRGCAMVAFTKWAHAEAAALAENGTSSHLSAPRAMTVKFADPQRRQEDGVLVGVTPKKLFVGQVAAGVTVDQVRAIFAPYGDIVDLSVMPPKRDGAPGCAFVTYSSWAAAEAAIEGVDGKFALPGSTNSISVRFADAKPADMMARVGAKRGAPDGMMMMGGGGYGGGYGGGGMMMMGGGGGGMMMGPLAKRGAYGAGAMGAAVGGAGAGGGMAGGYGMMAGAAAPMMGGGGYGAYGGGGGMGAMAGGGYGTMMGGGYGAMPQQQQQMVQQPFQQQPVGAGQQLVQQPLAQQAHCLQQQQQAGQQPQPQQQQQQQQPSQQPDGTNGLAGDGTGVAVIAGPLAPQGVAGAPGLSGGGGAVAGAASGGGGGGGGAGGGYDPAAVAAGDAVDLSATSPLVALAAAKAWKLFIGQVSFALVEADLFPFFAQFGTILELVLLRHPDGRSRGCGFLTYASRAEAEAAIAGANGIVLQNDVRGRPMQIRYAT